SEIRSVWQLVDAQSGGSPLRTCFFFQAEDGIRDGHVTGVQTCALPISAGCPLPSNTSRPCASGSWCCAESARSSRRRASRRPARAEERRVGKERRCQLASS